MVVTAKDECDFLAHGWTFSTLLERKPGPRHAGWLLPGFSSDWTITQVALQMTFRLARAER